ncbi:MAG: sulfatase [Actinoplanes sp.]
MRRMIAALLLTSALAACTSPPTGARPSASPVPASATPPPPAPAEPRNVVFVLTDDLSMNLLPYLPNVQALAAQGTSFTDFTVTDSLCCPSRASILTGKFPHNTGVFTNEGADGGFTTFERRGNEKSTFATDLKSAGYRTAFLGKYLNRYFPDDKHVPPGWTDWVGAGGAYQQYEYVLLENGRITRHGSRPQDYLGDVLSAKASAFITASAAAKKPFLVEVSTFAPHAPFTPAPADLKSFPGLRAPRGKAFGTLPTDPPSWLAKHPPMSPAELKALDVAFRKRVQAGQGVDRMVASLRATLDRTGVADDTVVVFTSDNGFHLGEYRLNPGKQTALDTDVRVPLIVAGPGVRAGAVVTVPAENIDLRPTFDELAGLTPPPDVDGRSLVPLLTGPAPAGWRDLALIEHHGPLDNPADPDNPQPRSGNPPSYQAIRSTRFTYVEYANGDREYYDLTNDPDQLHNLVRTLPAADLARLHERVAALSACRGSGCREADGSATAPVPQ